MFARSLSVCPIVLALSVAACGGTSPRIETPAAPRPGRVVHPTVVQAACVTGDRVIVCDDEYGLAALGLRDGSLLWKVPLEAHESLLFCDAEDVVTSIEDVEGFALRGRHPGDGRQTWKTQRLRPNGWLGIQDSHVSVWRSRKGGFSVRWTALRYWRGGYPPSPEEEAEAHREAEGGYHLVDGRATVASISKPSYPKASLPRFAYVSWDGAHASKHDATANRTPIWRLSDGKVVATMPGNVHSTPIFVTGELVVQATVGGSNQGDDRYSDVYVRVFDLRGNLQWERRIAHVLEPEPVP